jgi:hypothetical protein
LFWTIAVHFGAARSINRWLLQIGPLLLNLSMSDTPSEGSSPRRPKKRAPNDAERQRAVRKQTKRRKPQAESTRAPKVPQLIQVAADDDNNRTLLETLKSEAKTGVPGLLVSFALHAVILLILAVIVLNVNTGGDSALSFGWIPPNSSLDAKEFVAKPVKINSLRLTPKKKKVVDKKVAPKSAAGDDTIARPVKPVDVKRSLVARTEQMKAGALEKTGKKDAIQRALTSGLAWMARQQRKGGNWKLDSGYPDAGVAPVFKTDTGATALALLTLLGDGNTPFEGKYKDNVARGLKWLRGIQKVNGDFLDDSELGRQVAFYVHSQATIAICESYALTKDREYRECAEKAVQFLIDSQHPTQGGWRYQPQDIDSMGDLSVTSWAAMALHSARMANIEVPPEVFRKISVFVDSVESKNKALFKSGSRYRYLPSGDPKSFSPGMTSAGLLARQWLGWDKDDLAMKDGVRYLLSEKLKPEWGSKRNVYEWYYTAQTLHNVGGPNWKTWFDQVQKVIVESQRRRGSRKAPTDILGSWSPNDPYGANEEYAGQAGRLYITSMCLLILQTPYRHYPLYAQPPASPVPEEAE